MGQVIAHHSGTCWKDRGVPQGMGLEIAAWFAFNSTHSRDIMQVTPSQSWKRGTVEWIRTEAEQH